MKSVEGVVVSAFEADAERPIGKNGDSSPAMTEEWKVAERVRFELTCRNYPTIRFRVGAVMTASVPLRVNQQTEPFEIRPSLAGRVF